MADIHYKIQFFSYWHCGSGLAAGADVDALVVRDKCNLPFVPGKTMKGLVREAIENISAFKKRDNKDLINKTFGYFKDKDNSSKGSVFFTNAELEQNESKAIVGNDLQKYLYSTLSSTAIQDDGIAKDHTLRKMEVVVPCTLYGSIKNVP